MSDASRFPRLVALACHDLRTPLATVFGFARTLSKIELAEPGARYVAMIEAASAQMSDLLDELTLVARIEEGRYEPVFVLLDSLELARAAAAEVDVDPASVTGDGATVRVDEVPARRAVAQLVRAARRHGGLDSVEVAVDGPTVTIGPLTEYSAPVLLGEELRELQAAAAVLLVVALGGAVERADDRLLVRLPQ
ncbi:MAG: hypothetical protein E6G67_10775 [Actinobacteria bacterium]|nr:MAG: hypothetical protein E6G67_10775 [Actinomycetota bacterium]